MLAILYSPNVVIDLCFPSKWIFIRSWMQEIRKKNDKNDTQILFIVYDFCKDKK